MYALFATETSPRWRAKVVVKAAPGVWITITQLENIEDFYATNAIVPWAILKIAFHCWNPP